MHFGPGMPRSRWLTMALMLAVLAMVIVQARNPNNWRFLAQDKDDDIVVEKVSGPLPQTAPQVPAGYCPR